MKALKAIGVFFGTFFGLFVVINTVVVIIFPVSWNDVVTCPGWIVCYFVIGLIASVFTVDSHLSDNL